MLWLKNQNSVQIYLAFLVIQKRAVGSRPSKQKFDLKHVLLVERLCLILEIIDDVQGTRGILNRFLMILFHHVDDRDVGEAVLVVWVFL